MPIRNFIKDDNDVSIEVYPYFMGNPSLHICFSGDDGLTFEFTEIDEVDWLIERLEEVRGVIERKENTPANATT